MSRIYTFGETVFDIIFENDLPVAARAGGAMLNSAVSLGRCGHQVTLLTEMGQDKTGDQILAFLRKNNVSTDFIFPYPHHNTPVSLAYLGEDKSASYTFYKQYPESRLLQAFPDIQQNDLLLFGSFYSLSPAIHEKVAAMAKKTREAGGWVVYDPNIRKNHLDDVKLLSSALDENISFANVTRGSLEDFQNLTGSSDHEAIYAWVRERGCRHLVMTTVEGAYFFSAHHRLFRPSIPVNVVSSIGAGDSFNAGLIHGLWLLKNQGIQWEELTEANWSEAIDYGLAFAADCCASMDNYISEAYGRTILNS